MYDSILDIMEGHHELIPCCCGLRERIQEPPLIRINVPLDYMEPPPVWDSFQVRPKNEKAFNFCRGWAKKYATGQEYPAPLLCGPVGNGKTRLIWTILASIAKARDDHNLWLYKRELATANVQVEPNPRPPYRKFNYRYLTMPHFSEEIRIRARNHQDVVDYRKTVNQAEVLAIDDIGAENGTEFVREQFHMLIEERVVQRKPLLIACNFSLDEIEQWTGSRVMSRLRGACDIIEIQGSDMRIEEKARRVKQL